MNTVAIIQARMSSSRLPGKVMKNLGNKIVLEHVLGRLSQCKLLDDIVVATTTDKDDDILVEWCAQNKIKIYRGSRDNVLSRFFNCATKYKADVIVRVTSDNPLVDPEIVDQVIDLRRTMNADYAANNIKKTFPHGLDVEVITYKVLYESFYNATEEFELEHVTQYVRHRPDKYSLTNLSSIGDWYHIRVTLDEDTDRQLIELVLRVLGQDASFEGLKKLFSDLPILSSLNNTSKERHAEYNKREKII